MSPTEHATMLLRALKGTTELYDKFNEIHNEVQEQREHVASISKENSALRQEMVDIRSVVDKKSLDEVPDELEKQLQTAFDRLTSHQDGSGT